MSEHQAWKAEVRSHLERLRIVPAREEEIVEELAQHLQDDYRRLLASGVSEPEARKTALEGLSDPKLLASELRTVERATAPEPIALGEPSRNSLLGDFVRDLRYALRTFKSAPGFATVAVLSLALGIGGNAAMFSIVSAILIRPLPYRDTGRLVDIPYYYPSGAVVAIQQASKTMELSGVSAGLQLNLTGQGEAMRLAGGAVSANFFVVLGVGADLGRTFRDGEDQPGRDDVVILSHSLWLDKFGGNADVIGKVISLGGTGRQVVGVMAPGFTFPDATTQFWIPLHLDPRDARNYWNVNFMPMIARLRPGATLAQARGELKSLTARVITLFPYPMGRDWNSDATVEPLQSTLVQDVRSRLIILQAAIGLVLLIACVNVSSLLLARATARRKEIALRAALGAAPGRIVRQLLTESVTLALVGGSLGLALAFGAFSSLKVLLPASAAHGADVRLGWPILIFVTALSIITGLAFGLAPTLTVRNANLAGTMKTGGQRSAASGGARLRGALIAGEVALAVVLAVSAGLLIKSLWLLTQVNPGFQPEHLLTLQVSPDSSLCRERAACVELYRELLERTQEITGVSGVAAADAVPLKGEAAAIAPVDIEGHSRNPKQSVAPLLWAGAVTPDYFRVLRIPIVEGRTFNDSDREKSAPVVIVSAATARRYWPGQNPIGKHLRPVWDTAWRTVVGVAADVRQYNLAGHSPSYLSGAFYMPYSQATNIQMQLPASMTLLVRTGSDPAPVASRIRVLVRDLNPDVPVSEIRTMDSLVSESIQPSRSMMWLFLGFAGAALLLAAIGTYGVVSYSTSQRTFEIGMRMALGATKRNIFALVLGQSLRLAVVGLAAGVVVSLVVTRMLSAFLYGTAATDPVTFLTVCGLVVAVAMVAGYVPARRAASVDPLTALRVE